MNLNKWPTIFFAPWQASLIDQHRLLVIGGSDGCSDLDSTELLDLSLGELRQGCERWWFLFRESDFKWIKGMSMNEYEWVWMSMNEYEWVWMSMNDNSGIWSSTPPVPRKKWSGSSKKIGQTTQKVIHLVPNMYVSASGGFTGPYFKVLLMMAWGGVGWGGVITFMYVA